MRTLCAHCNEPYTALPELVDELGLRKFTNGDAIQKECLAEGGDKVVTRLLKVDNLEQRADLAVRAVGGGPELECL